MPHRIRYPLYDLLPAQEETEVREFCEAVLDQEARELDISVSGNLARVDVDLADPMMAGKLRIEMPFKEVIPSHRHEGTSPTGENLRESSGVEAKAPRAGSSAKFIVSKTARPNPREQWVVEVPRDLAMPVTVTYPKEADKKRVVENIGKSLKKATLD